MTLKSNAKFGKWHKELGKFSPERSKVSKLALMRSFYPKKKMYELKIYKI